MVFVLTLFRRGLFLKSTEKKKNNNNPPFKISAYIYVIITGDFEHFQHYNFEKNILKTKTAFKKLEFCFSGLKWKIQIEWGVQNVPSIKNGVLALTTSFFLKKQIIRV